MYMAEKGSRCFAAGFHSGDNRQPVQKKHCRKIRTLMAAGLCAFMLCQNMAITALAAVAGTVVGPGGSAAAAEGDAALNGSLTPVTDSAPAADGGAPAAVVEAGISGAAVVEAGAAGAVLVEANADAAADGTQTVTAGSSQSTGSRSGVMTVGSSAAAGILSTMGETGQTLSPMLGGAVLTMFNSRTDSQILSCMLQTQDGSLIVVDGGLGADADYLTEQIAARGGHVAAWLLTHPHGDHVGALYRILQNEDARYASGQSAQVTIDKIYYNFADLSWYQTNDPGEYTMEAAMIGTLSGRPASMLQVVNRGETYTVGNAEIQVLNSPYETGTDKGNNSGIVYRVVVNGVSILFTGDMSQEGGSRLLADVGAAALKSDIVQMAHHGQNGVSEEFYKAVSPTVCLWPTPGWLWLSTESKYLIQTTKSWMKELGVAYHYVMKDGDQVIQ